MDSLNNGSSNSPRGLTLYHAIEDHIFGGMMLEEYEDGNLYLDWEVDEKIAELESRIELLESAIVESNDSLKGGEGIDLLYYYHECDDDEGERDLIKSLITK